MFDDGACVENVEISIFNCFQGLHMLCKNKRFLLLLSNLSVVRDFFGQLSITISQKQKLWELCDGERSILQTLVIVDLLETICRRLPRKRIHKTSTFFFPEYIWRESTCKQSISNDSPSLLFAELWSSHYANSFSLFSSFQLLEITTFFAEFVVQA